MKPLVSVIMPAYNGERFIAEAIQSIISQTYENWELMIIEDKSTDGTLDIIRSFSDSRIKLFENAQNRGIVYNTNYGIDNSSGKYIALLDDDDVAMKDRFEYQVDFLEKHDEVDVLGGWNRVIDENGDLIKIDTEPLKNPKLIEAYQLFFKKLFTDCTVMYRRDFLDKNGIRYREGYLGMHDAKFYMECSKVGTITSIDRFLIDKRFHSEEETERQRRNNSAARREAYSRMQRESLTMSGFKLSEEHLTAINQNLCEIRKKKYEISDVLSIYSAFAEIARQAREMKIDYYEELLFALKRIIGERILPYTDIL